MRDRLVNNLHYFNNFIENQKTRLERLSLSVSSGETTDEHIPDTNHLIFIISLEKLIASFSAGASVDSLQSHYRMTLKRMLNGWDDIKVRFQKGKPPKKVMLDKYFLMPYNYMIWMLSLGILLKVSDKEINDLKRLIEDDNIDDELIISLLSFLTGQKSNKTSSKTTYKPFSFIIQSEQLIDTEKKMKAYLDKWYQRTTLLMWHNYKPEPNKYFYFGRWSFEAAAVVAIKGLDDASFRDNEYYPKDLVDFYKSREE